MIGEDWADESEVTIPIRSPIFYFSHHANYSVYGTRCSSFASFAIITDIFLSSNDSATVISRSFVLRWAVATL